VDTTTTGCPDCGEPTATGWEFCRACGQTLQPQTAANGLAIDASGTVVLGLPNVDTLAGTRLEPIGQAERGRSSRLWKIAGVVVVVLCTGAAVAAGGFLWRTTHENLVESESLLAGVRAELATTENEFTAVQQQLADTSAQLDATVDTLSATQRSLASEVQRAEAAEGERDALTTKVNATESELEGVRGSLNETRGRVELQAGQIQILRSCLNGVLLALNYAAYDDWSSAIASLEAVETSCQEATELL
jgi:hypothetical protein